MTMESEQTGAPDSELTPETLGIAFGLHAVLFLVVFVIGLFNTTPEPVEKPKENLVPIDMTIVPPWAKKTDDPNPDPNPQKQEKRQKPKAQEKKKPEVKKKVDVKNKDALVKVKENETKKNTPAPIKKGEKKRVEQPTPKPTPPTPKPKDPPPPPDPKLQKLMDQLKAGKGTAAEDPIKDIDLDKMLNQGYRIGAHNQLAANEAQRCASLIKEAIHREWNKESFNWHSGLRPIKVDFQLGAGGIVRGFAIQSGSDDAEVDRTALNALKRLKDKGGIPALSKSFIDQYPRLTVTMEPTQGR